MFYTPNPQIISAWPAFDRPRYMLPPLDLAKLVEGIQDVCDLAYQQPSRHRPVRIAVYCSSRSTIALYPNMSRRNLDFGKGVRRARVDSVSLQADDSLDSHGFWVIRTSIHSVSRLLVQYFPAIPMPMEARLVAPSHLRSRLTSRSPPCPFVDHPAATTST